MSRKTFDFNTIEDFDTHINASIPYYNILNDAIRSMSKYFFSKGSNIFDLGCSTGAFLRSLETDCKKVGIDNSNLLPTELLESDNNNNLIFMNADLNEVDVVSNACVVYSIFTMQFLDPSKRKRYLNSIFNGLNEGGALFLCEKVYQESGIMENIITFSHYDYKSKRFSAEEIILKERDLRYIMKPCSNAELHDMLYDAGFSIVSDFWQMFNFKGILAIKK